MALNGEGRGRMAKAPPPEAFQLMLRYRCKDKSATMGQFCDIEGADRRCRDKIGIPSTTGHFYILDPIFFLGRLSEDMSAILGIEFSQR